MKKSKYALILLFLLIGNLRAQTVIDYYFDESKGVYVIDYTLGSSLDSIYQAIYYPGDQVSPDVNIYVEYSQGSDFLRFQYDVKNKEEAKLELYTFAIELKAEISSFQNPSTYWFGGYYEKYNAYDWAKVSGNSPGIPPGQIESGFGFSTKGLPTISNGFASSLTSLFFYNQEIYEEPPAQVTSILDSIRANTKHVSFKTVSVWLPDPSLSLESLTDTLETFRFRSCEELEWVNDTSVCAQLEDDLEEVKTALESEDSLTAANALKRFIDLVEAEKDASLTSEGYALMYFNAQYLAERLPEPQVGSAITCGCDNPVTQSSGTITLRNGETQCLSQPFSGSVFFESGGTLNVCSTAEFGNVYGNQPGQINVSETGEVTVGGWNNNATEDAFTNWGSVAFTNWTTINNGSLTNHGEMSISGGLNQNNGPLVNTGELTVAGSATFNQPGNRNEGTFSAGSLTLNSNAELVNECRVESSGPVMINGDFIQQSGGFLLSENQLSVNSGGTLFMQGGQAMAQVNGVMLNGAIESIGINLLVSSAAFSFNSGANITAGAEPFYLVAPNLSEVPSSFNVADGSSLSVPPSTCNPTGYPSGQ